MFFTRYGMIKINDHAHNVNDDYDDDVSEDDGDDDDGDDVGGDAPGQECLGNVEPWRHSLTEGNDCQGNAGFAIYCYFGKCVCEFLYSQQYFERQ